MARYGNMPVAATGRVDYRGCNIDIGKMTTVWWTNLPVKCLIDNHSIDDRLMVNRLMDDHLIDYRLAGTISLRGSRDGVPGVGLKNA